MSSSKQTQIGANQNEWMEDIKARLYGNIHLKFLIKIRAFFKISNDIMLQCINEHNFTIPKFTLWINITFNSFTPTIFYIYIIYYREPKLTSHLFPFETFYNLKRSQPFFYIFKHHYSSEWVLAYCLIFLLYILVSPWLLLCRASKFPFSYHKSVIFK